MRLTLFNIHLEVVRVQDFYEEIQRILLVALVIEAFGDSFKTVTESIPHPQLFVKETQFDKVTILLWIISLFEVLEQTIVDLSSFCEGQQRVFNYHLAINFSIEVSVLLFIFNSYFFLQHSVKQIQRMSCNFVAVSLCQFCFLKVILEKCGPECSLFQLFLLKLSDVEREELVFDRLETLDISQELLFPLLPVFITSLNTLQIFWLYTLVLLESIQPLNASDFINVSCFHQIVNYILLVDLTVRVRVFKSIQPEIVYIVGRHQTLVHFFVRSQHLNEFPNSLLHGFFFLSCLLQALALQ